MKKLLIMWLLRRLGYPTHKLVEGVPSLLAVVHNGQVTYATSQSPHVARAKCREHRARAMPNDDVRLVLYRAVRVEES